MGCAASSTGCTSAKGEYGHYFRLVPFQLIDVYRVLLVFGVTDPCLQHAIKKLLVAGGRGHKDSQKDIQEAIDSLKRWQQMRKEEANDIS
jgi:hypothetical protein